MEVRRKGETGEGGRREGRKERGKDVWRGREGGGKRRRVS